MRQDIWDVVRRQLGGGGGGELRSDAKGGIGQRAKFCSAWSSAALAVSSVTPFLERTDESLRVASIPGIGDAGPIEFEAKRTAGVPRRWPNLDFVIDGGSRSVFLESKTTEYLCLTHGKLATVYAERAREILSEDCADEVAAVVENHQRYALVDAPQLIKHVLAAKTAAIEHDRQVTLVYAYWEPTNRQEHGVFAEHRDQVERLFGRLASAGVGLVAQSWPELWARWKRYEASVTTHVRQLHSRYSVYLPAL